MILLFNPLFPNIAVTTCSTLLPSGLDLFITHCDDTVLSYYAVTVGVADL